MYAHLWQIGTALTDLVGWIQESDDLSRRGLIGQRDESRASWASRRMVSYSLRRLRGNPPLAILPPVSKEKPWPRCIERILDRMERFPAVDEPTHAQIAFLVAMFAEGRALAERNRCQSASEGQQGLAGYATALLAKLTRCQFRADEELSEHLPEIGVTDLESEISLRRHSLAWYRLSCRLSPLVTADPCADVDPTLKALAAGTRLLAIAVTLQSQVLEQWALLKPASQEQFCAHRPDPVGWELEANLFVHWHQGDREMPLDFLWSEFSKATSGHLASPFLLEHITPLGWLILLGAMAGFLPGAEGGPGIRYQEDVREELRQGLSALGRGLAAPCEDERDLPWGDMREVREQWTMEHVAQTLRLLAKLDAAFGVEVMDQVGPLQLSSGPGRTIELMSSDGFRRTLAKWQEQAAFLCNDRSRDIEHVTLTESSSRKSYRWSETWEGTNLLAIGVISPAMASLSGLSPRSSRATAITAPAAVTSLPHVVSNSEVSAPPMDSSVESVSSPVDMPSSAGPSNPPLNAGTSAQSPPLNAIAQLQTAQRDSWRLRAKPQSRYARIALLQWQVDETYRHPLFDACLRDARDRGFQELLDRNQHPSRWTRHSFDIPSCVEYRRHRILEEVLEACRHFKVDILLLPEYSIRLDTIAWLVGELPQRAPETSVWAGTYRLPPTSQNAVLSHYGRPFPDWSAVLTVIPTRDQ
ncbi:MAG: hypothetical protein U1E05_07570, partial [Patescibacteria group bacterium]|nr:hypothetical protein [Patescibacteria group bacterium]